MKKISWWEPEIGRKEYKLIQSVLKSNFPNEGKLTTEFENKIQDLLKVKYAVAVTSGTAAIFLSLKALGIGHGDEVIVPDLTFIATANAVVMSGATPILVDVDNESLTIDTVLLRKAITPRTKAIIPVHVSGRASNMKQLKKIARENKLFIVEDAAEAFTSKYNGRFLGTIGDAGCFSFSPAKTITTGQGGVIVTNNTKLALKLRELKDQGRPIRGTGGDDIHYSIGFNFKFTDLQAALGIGQLDYLNARISRIKKTYKLYKKLLNDVKQIRILDFKINENEVPQWVDAICEKRNALDKYLSENNIHCRRLWHPIHRQKPYKLADTMFPNSSSISPNALWLPSSFNMTDNDVVTVCRYIEKFYTK
jgi:perosamine synthetase